MVAANTKKAPPGDGWGLITSGNNLLSRSTHYHRLRLLNGRVRNGNGCGQPDMITGKFVNLWRMSCILLQTEPWLKKAREKRNNAVKRSAVSTG